MDRKHLEQALDRVTFNPDTQPGPFDHMPILGAFKPKPKPIIRFDLLTDEERQALLDYYDNRLT